MEYLKKLEYSLNDISEAVRIERHKENFNNVAFLHHLYRERIRTIARLKYNLINNCNEC